MTDTDLGTDTNTGTDTTTTSVNLVLPHRNLSLDLSVVATNDEHYDSLVNDPDFYGQMQQRNTQFILPVSMAMGGPMMSAPNMSNTYGMVNTTRYSPAVNPNTLNLENAALTKAGTNAADGADVLVANTNEDWINKKWRPAMGWMYMAVCTFDFIVFPIAWSLLQALTKGSVTTPWQPITLQGAGLFHIAMGAVLGISAFGRTQEKIQGATAIDTSVATSPPAS